MLITVAATATHNVKLTATLSLRVFYIKEHTVQKRDVVQKFEKQFHVIRKPVTAGRRELGLFRFITTTIGKAGHLRGSGNFKILETYQKLTGHHAFISTRQPSCAPGSARHLLDVLHPKVVLGKEAPQLNMRQSGRRSTRAEMSGCGDVVRSYGRNKQGSAKPPIKTNIHTYDI